MKNQSLIVLHGLSGSGKSTATDLIKFQLKPSVVLGADRLRFHITDFKGEEKAKYFDLTRDIMMGMVSDYLDKGFTIICEDQFKKNHIEQLKKIAEFKNVPFLSYEFSVSEKTRHERLEKRILENQTQTPPDLKFRKWQFHEYVDNKYTDSFVFDTELISPEDITKKILSDIELSLKII